MSAVWIVADGMIGSALLAALQASVESHEIVILLSDQIPNPADVVIVFAHTLLPSISRSSQHGGLERLEQVMGDPRFEARSVLVLGWLERAEYGELRYLVTEGSGISYHRLPCKRAFAAPHRLPPLDYSCRARQVASVKFVQGKFTTHKGEKLSEDPYWKRADLLFRTALEKTLPAIALQKDPQIFEWPDTLGRDLSEACPVLAVAGRDVSEIIAECKRALTAYTAAANQIRGLSPQQRVGSDLPMGEALKTCVHCTERIKRSMTELMHIIRDILQEKQEDML